MRSPATPRRAGALPFPELPAGAVDERMPFDHLVVVMMENHSFDNLLGSLSRSRRDVDGLTFDADGSPLNENPGTRGTPDVVKAFAFQDTTQGRHVTQTWTATHEQIDGGRMDGFVRTAGADQPMGYYTAKVLPFAHSLGQSFTVANRWFASVPGPTFPNRRFLVAGTAWGGTETSLTMLLDPPPPHGTIFDRMSEHSISWVDYFTDVPSTLLIPSSTLKHLDHHRGISGFFHDCQAGTLPAVSFVDPGIGVLSSLAGAMTKLPGPVKDVLRTIGARLDAPAETEEDPQDMYWGESWAHDVVQAVLRSPKWSRTLLVYTYDEHGGYYDHVPPPAAIPPDAIPPDPVPDPPGGYDRYGPRVPAIVVSPYAKPGAVTDVVHDHTSILATIEAKWNLPALTDRDANAATVLDFLDLDRAALITPPAVQGPSTSGPSGPVHRP